MSRLWLAIECELTHGNKNNIGGDLRHCEVAIDENTSKHECNYGMSEHTLR